MATSDSPLLPVGLTDADIARIAAAIDSATPASACDRARSLLGYVCALRTGELAALRMSDLESQPGGLLLHVRRSKTDQEARGQVVAVAPGHHRYLTANRARCRALLAGNGA